MRISPAPPNTVAFILPSFAGGGAERVMLTLARTLDRARYAPHIVVLSGQGPLKHLAGDLPVRDLGVPRLRHALGPLARAINDVQPRVAISTMGYLNLGVLQMRRRLPRATKILIREANEPAATIKALGFGPLGALAYRILYRRADSIVAPSQHIARLLTGRFALDPARIKTLYNPIDDGSIRASAVPPRRTGHVALVAAGRLTRQKGFDRVLDMFAALPDDRHLTILGDGPDRAALAERARRLGIVARVALPGFDPAPWPHYAGADAFLLPSRWEGMPNAALEALACGTKVIATPDAGAIDEIARLATPGAVTIAAAGDAFTAALRAVEPDAISAPRPSLLPASFALDTARAQFAKILDELCAA